jgi:hypothetical protein
MRRSFRKVSRREKKQLKRIMRQTLRFWYAKAIRFFKSDEMGRFSVSERLVFPRRALKRGAPRWFKKGFFVVNGPRSYSLYTF